MQEDQKAALDRRSLSTTRAVLVGVAGPLITALVFGYVTLYTNYTKLVTIAELTERRLTAIEADYRQQVDREREIQILITRFGQKLDMIHQELSSLKEDQKELGRRTSR